MEKKEVLITKEGYEKIVEELNYLKSEKRQDIAEKIKTAREFGDISENSEYDEAKNEQAEVESKILELEYTVKYAKFIEENNNKKNRVDIGTKVVVLDIEYDEENTYYILGEAEADTLVNKISNVSPMGAALIGKKVEDVVDVKTPSGILQYKILKISNKKRG